MFRNAVSRLSLQRQAGLSLVKAALVSGLLAGVGMIGMLSMRSERNLFAETGAKVRSAVTNNAAADAVSQSLPGAKLRKCLVNGKTVISNTDCKDGNPTSRDLKLQLTRGVEAPKVPVPAPEAAGSNPALDKIIEKQAQ